MGIRTRGRTIYTHELEARRFSDLDIYARSSSIHAKPPIFRVIVGHSHTTS